MYVGHMVREPDLEFSCMVALIGRQSGQTYLGHRDHALDRTN